MPQGNMDYTYLSNGLRSTMEEVGVGTTTYGYDDAGRITSLNNAFGENTTWTYDTAGRVDLQTFASGMVADHDYDARGHLTGIQHRTSTGTVRHDEDYTRDLFADRMPLLKWFKYPAVLVVFLLFAAAAVVVLLQGFLSYTIYGALLAAALVTTVLFAKREQEALRQLLGATDRSRLKPPKD